MTGEVPARQEQPPKPQPPSPLRWARWLWIVSAGLGVVRSLMQLADRELMIDQLRGRAGDVSQDQLDAMANTAVVVGLFLVLAIFGGYVLLARKMVAGANWARIVLAVLGGIGIVLAALYLVVALGGAADVFKISVGGDELALTVVGVLMDITALALMFHPAANAFFARGVEKSNFPVR